MTAHLSFPVVRYFILSALVLLFVPAGSQAQSERAEIEELKNLVLSLDARVTVLERQNAELMHRAGSLSPSGPDAAASLVRAVDEIRRPAPDSPSIIQQSPISPAPSTQSPPPLPLPANLPGGATLNYLFDGYYEYNFNNPPGRANDLRAYDVLSNVFSLNQADLVFALDPDTVAKRRYGIRLDLQFGQATETLQGNPENETRPEIYRNIFQAYGTYVVPVGSGLNVDFGKWASSLGVEGNYTKDQMNYSRSFYYSLLPFYHFGVRTSYHINDKLAVNYWIVNGTNQSEPTNGYKDELFGFVLQPAKSLTWTANYYLGQEHPDSAPATNCPVPVQPGLCGMPISPAPNGKLDILDSYATWQVNPKLTLQGEGDYVIQREWANAAPGESSAPSHVSGGVGYAQYLLSPRTVLAARGEYLSDRNGMFSGTIQTLKEGTATYEYKLADGFDTFLEYRRDWSNRPYFQTGTVGKPVDHQDTATVGLVWWYGGKQGAW
ncbi:MAG: outer membrane beta-barrel protein [Terracidiphilus sp.]